MVDKTDGFLYLEGKELDESKIENGSLKYKRAFTGSDNPNASSCKAEHNQHNQHPIRADLLIQQLQAAKY